jgi:hypothetical protein
MLSEIYTPAAAIVNARNQDFLRRSDQRMQFVNYWFVRTGAEVLNLRPAISSHSLTSMFRVLGLLA